MLTTAPHAARMATLPQGWLALPDRRLGGVSIPLVLLHPRHGVVLAGGPADGPARLRQRLEAGRFPAIFHGHLPIARTDQPPADPAAALQGQPPLSLPGGEAWVLAACRALENEAPVSPPQRLGFRARRRRTRRRLALALGGTAALVLLLGLGVARLPPSPLGSAYLASAPIAPPVEIGAPPGNLPPAPAQAGLLPRALPPLLPAPLAVPAPGTLVLAPAPPATGAPPLPRPPVMALGVPPEPEAPAATAAPAPRRAPSGMQAMMTTRVGRIATQPDGPAMRCRSITQRMQIGETVADADIQFLRLGCPG